MLQLRLFASVFLLLLIGCSFPENLQPVDPAPVIPRPLEVSSSAWSMEWGEEMHVHAGSIDAWRAFPLTEFESPWLIVLASGAEITDEWKAETERLASLGYIVLCFPELDEEEISNLLIVGRILTKEEKQSFVPSMENIIWGQVLLQSVEALSRLRQTRGRRGAVIGFGDNSIRALQLSIVEPRVTAAVAWNPQPVSGKAILPESDLDWMIIAAADEYDSAAISDWMSINGIGYYPVRFDTVPDGFDQPDEVGWYSRQADQARAAQHQFLLERIGSTMSPSLQEITTLSGDDLPEAEILYEDLPR